jgi:hypothetical protein
LRNARSRAAGTGEQPDQQITIARDERTLGDDAEGESLTPRQMLQDGARDPEAPLGRLIRIRGRADHDRLADRHALEIGGEGAHDLLFDEDAPLERFPPVRPPVIREFRVGQLTGVVRPLDDIAVGVTRVAVSAAEFTSDERIQGPVVHPGGAGWVEDALGS